MATSTINSMGKLNNPWGICGFTSALYALHEHTGQQQQGGLSSAAETETRMLAEIKSYLRMLQAEKRADLLDKIQIFTRSFGGQWAAFDIDKYIGRINALGQIKPNEKVDPAKLGDFSIAMPPDAVVDYLQRMCDFKLAHILTGKESDPKELILGVSKPNMKMYNGLAHWVYLKDGVVYSWGVQFVSVENFLTAKSYDGVVWKIAVT